MIIIDPIGDIEREFNPPKKIFLKYSPGRGMGVFASEPIAKGEVLEVCHIHILNPIEEQMPYHGFGLPKEHPAFTFIPWGYGCVYNHSSNPNIIVECDGSVATFTAIKDIKKLEECFHYYGDRYWENKNIKPI